MLIKTRDQGDKTAVMKILCTFLLSNKLCHPKRETLFLNFHAMVLWLFSQPPYQSVHPLKHLSEHLRRSKKALKRVMVLPAGFPTGSSVEGLEGLLLGERRGRLLKCLIECANIVICISC